MPKSRKRRKKAHPGTRTPKLRPSPMDVLKKQREAFIKKFGREPGPNDPVFFNPDADTPEKMTGDDMVADVLKTMQKAGLPPEIAYAFRKTGLLYLGGDRSLWPPEHVAEWDAAVAEYRALEKSSKEGGSH